MDSGIAQVPPTIALVWSRRDREIRNDVSSALHVCRRLGPNGVRVGAPSRHRAALTWALRTGGYVRNITGDNRICNNATAQNAPVRFVVADYAA